MKELWEKTKEGNTLDLKEPKRNIHLIRFLGSYPFNLWPPISTRGVQIFEPFCLQNTATQVEEISLSVQLQKSSLLDMSFA